MYYCNKKYCYLANVFVNETSGIYFAREDKILLSGEAMLLTPRRLSV